MAKSKDPSALGKSVIDMLSEALRAGEPEFHDAGWFKFRWDALAAEGRVDEWDSAECRRVCMDWLAAKRPLQDDFLLKHANATPSRNPEMFAAPPA